MITKHRRRRTIIPKFAVKAFLARKRRDFSLYKEKSLRWLQDRMEELPLRPPIWKRLRKEQRVGFIAGVETRKFCFWYDTGMGKTLLSVALIRYFKRLRIVRRVLIVVQNKINKHEFALDIKKHSPKSTITILEGSSKNKWKQLEEAETTFILETYGGLVRMMCVMVTIEKKKKKITKLVPVRQLMKRMLLQVQGIIMDESINVVRKQRHGSLMHRLCRKIAKESKIAFALNGTPFGSDPTDMWGQFHIIDQGETLGQTLGLFRATFFHATDNHWGQIEYEFDKTKKKLLHQIINNRSIRYEAKEGTLPKVTSIVKYVSFAEGADEYYEKARQQIIASSGNFRALKNAFLRMRQVSSGFVGYDDDELGVRAQYEFKPNPKLDMLLSIVERVTPAHKLVIFHEFTFSGGIIEREVKNMGIPCARLYGKSKDPDGEVTRFHGDKRCRVLVLQNSMAIGLDRIKVAKYGVYFESPVGTVQRVQSRRRIERQESMHERVFIYDLVTRGTVDQQILDAHEQGIDLFKAVIDRRVKLK